MNDLIVTPMKQLPLILSLITFAISYTLINMAIIGSGCIFIESPPYSRALHEELLKGSTSGPLLFGIISARMVWDTWKKRPVSVIIRPAGVLAAVLTIFFAREYGHEFSHVVFNSCSCVYTDRSIRAVFVLILLIGAIHKLSLESRSSDVRPA